ncbi:DUF1684 domain-containing protein [Cognatiluteimonas weifangensis]|uniref:DUF1684 domain-containing protein n=1 Tax=Cognatiluteimonas weifangensis TaxID=2303539 RepID=A0A372DJ27_9GAMM|nr:DUF1684 domain-containing protein [Luteimonas weifangensis]RFP59529.1 DUF1684 domain-containing protein [Luteimonas weifangensis]
MPRIRHLLLAAAAIALVVGCQRHDNEGTPTVDQAAAATAFARAEQAWRDQRRERLLAADGWASLIGLHWIDPGSHYLGSDADNGIRLAMGPEHLGMLDLKGGQLRFVPDAAAAPTLDGQPLAAAAPLRTDTAPAGPSVIGFDAGRGQATVIERGGRYALRVKHADAPTRVRFAGLAYWPADATWKIEGTFVPHPPGKTLEIANIIGTVDAVPNPGAVEFTRDGKTYRLEALDEGEGELFLVFADRTNGRGSYGAGRFLYAPMPDAAGKVVLDFNRSYNPPCAFTAFATCPLPPPENRLDLAITAGEQAYAKPPHS